jgi:Druantia protein DruA
MVAEANGATHLDSAKHRWQLPTDELSLLFARSVVRDLRVAGIEAGVECKDDTPWFVLRPGATLNAERIRDSQRQRARKLLRRAQSHAAALLPEGSLVSPTRITPVLRLCESSDDIALFEYCRLSQAVPSGQRIGRQIRALVFDVGQMNSPLLMGAIGLASPVYTLKCRDQLLHWTGSAARTTKERGLRRMMDLHLCVALPPYSSFLGGKLLAALAVSSHLSTEFGRRYRDRLLAIASSCATGIHCPIFNRIGLRRGGLYRRIGTTAGYTLSWMSPATLRLARRVADSDLGVTPHSILAFDSKPLIVVRKALKVLGLPFEPLLRLGRPRGVYLAAASPDGLDLLQRGASKLPPIQELPTEVVIDHWREAFLTPRLESSSMRAGESRVGTG